MHTEEPVLNSQQLTARLANLKERPFMLRTRDGLKHVIVDRKQLAFNRSLISIVDMSQRQMQRYYWPDIVGIQELHWVERRFTAGRTE
jgi:hypothetical protein